MEPSLLFQSDDSDVPFNDFHIGSYHGALWRENSRQVSLWGRSGESQCSTSDEICASPVTLKSDDLELVEAVVSGANHTVLVFAFG